MTTFIPSSNPVHQAFVLAFDTNETFRDDFLTALAKIGTSLEEFDDPTTWSECLECLYEEMQSNLNVEIVQGVPGADAMLYPLATYGWDGGNAINTKQLNLTDLVLVHVSGGPCANIVRRTNESYPGVALHHSEGDKELTIQLF